MRGRGDFELFGGQSFRGKWVRGVGGVVRAVSRAAVARHGVMDQRLGDASVFSGAQLESGSKLFEISSSICGWKQVGARVWFDELFRNRNNSFRRSTHRALRVAPHRTTRKDLSQTSVWMRSTTLVVLHSTRHANTLLRSRYPFDH